MAQAIVQKNQFLLDVVAGEYGSIDAAISVCLANNMSITELPAAGTVVELPQVPRALANEATVRYLKGNGIVIGTRGPEVEEGGGEEPRPLEMAVLLRPMMSAAHVNIEVEGGGVELIPDRLRYTATEEWVNVNELAEEWQYEIAWKRVNLDDWNTGGYAESEDDAVLATFWAQADKKLDISMQASIIVGTKSMVFSKTSGEIAAIYEDTEGNIAFYGPFSLLYDGTTEFRSWIGSIGAELVSSDGELATVRWTMGHEDMTGEEFEVVRQEFCSISRYGVWSARSESAVNEIDMAPGVYRYGVRTTYRQVSPEPYEDGPMSFKSMVIQIY